MSSGIPGQYAFLLMSAASIGGVAGFGVARGETFDQVVRRDYVTSGASLLGSGDVLLWLAQVALVATGVQMFQYHARIVAFGGALLGTCAVVSLVNILATAAVAPLVGISPEITFAAMMRCITVPIALPIYDRICERSGTDGNQALVGVCCLISGFLGFGFSKQILSSGLCRAHLSQPVTRGMATGSSAHALGAATYAATETEAFVWAMLAMATSSVLSAAWICLCPNVLDSAIVLANSRL